MKHSSEANRQFAVLIERLVDRFLPDTSAWSGKPALRVRYGVSAAGAFTSCVVLLFWFVRFDPQILQFAPKLSTFALAPAGISALAILFTLLFASLIGGSVRRGTPLNYYLWGVAIPVLVTRILAFGIGGMQ